MTIGDRLKQLISASSYTRTEISVMAKISKQTLYKYENNIVTNIPSDKIMILSKILHTSPAYLMGWDVDQIREITERQKDVAEYEAKMNENLRQRLVTLSTKQIVKLTEILDHKLTSDEMDELAMYAQFIVNKRKN